MHKYMRTIGFSQLNSKKQLVNILQRLMDNKDSLEENLYSKADGSTFVEIKTYYGDNFGIIWSGYLIDGKEFQLDYITPFARAIFPNKADTPSIEQKKDSDSFMGIYDDTRIGVSLIFQIQNTRTCYNLMDTDASLASFNIMFAALSTSGRILLPIAKDSKTTDEMRLEQQKHDVLINAARKGDEGAIETLTLEDIDIYSKISKRVKHEDIFSIVDSSFMPSGLECDLYTVICEIIYCEKNINILTKEELYFLHVSCNGLLFTILINVKDLMGEPLPGRRFKGTVWLQGKIDPSYK